MLTPPKPQTGLSKALTVAYYEALARQAQALADAAQAAAQRAIERARQ